MAHDSGPTLQGAAISAAVADLVRVAVPLLRQRYGLEPLAANEAARELGEAFCQRAARHTRRSRQASDRHAAFIADMLEIVRAVLGALPGVGDSQAAALASKVTEAVCGALQRKMVHVPSFDRLAASGIFEAPLADQPPDRLGRMNAPRFVGAIVSAGSEALQSAALNIEPATALQAMREVARRVCFLNARCTVYVPRADVFEQKRRDAEIRADYERDSPLHGGPRKFTGERVQEIAAARGMTVQNVYMIIRAGRAVCASSAVKPGLSIGARVVAAEAA